MSDFCTPVKAFMAYGDSIPMLLEGRRKLVIPIPQKGFMVPHPDIRNGQYGSSSLSTTDDGRWVATLNLQS